jgi:H+/Cl- antiporter ClcA
MERVILNESRIPPRMMFFKPISAAVAIGTGGPFGAEGPIIATGAAFGSFIGQILPTDADERRTLLAAGAAAGMAATFGAPLSAVLLAVELLLFEFRGRSIVPTALACATAAGARMLLVGSEPVFPMPMMKVPSGEAQALYIVIGAVIGLISVAVTRAVYRVEDAFEKVPLHWCWWPAIGGLVVGLVGMLEPKTLGVGYSNITAFLSGEVAARAAISLVLLKFSSWVIALGSGTSGGTLAPLFTIGGGLGVLLAMAANAVFPGAHVDPAVGALVGMAALFAGSSRALLASIVFAFETTRQPLGLMPLLSGCSAAFLFSSLWMKYSIMTERLVRRGSLVDA